MLSDFITLSDADVNKVMKVNRALQSIGAPFLVNCSKKSDFSIRKLTSSCTHDVNMYGSTKPILTNWINKNTNITPGDLFKNPEKYIDYEKTQNRKTTARAGLKKEEPKKEKIVIETIPIKSTKKLIKGDKTVIETPGEKIEAYYAVMEIDKVEASNNPFTFTKNPNYPAHCQERTYDNDAAEKNKVLRNESNFNAKFLISDDPTALNGPPIVEISGAVLGGNGRIMTLKRVAENRDYKKLYTDFLVNKLKQYGINESISHFKNPVLVRLIDVDLKRCAYYSRVLNAGLTQEMDVQQKAISYSRDLNYKYLDEIGNILTQSDADTLAQVLGLKTTARQILDVFKRAEIINQSNQSQWIDNNGDFTQFGKIYVETTLLGSILDDKRVIEAAKVYTNKIVKVIPYLMRLKRLGNWNITNEIIEACKLEHKRQVEKLTKKHLLNQGIMFGEKIPEKVIQVWDILELPQAHFKLFLEKYTETAENSASIESAGGDMFGEKPKKPKEALMFYFDKIAEIAKREREAKAAKKKSKEGLNDFIIRKEFY